MSITVGDDESWSSLLDAISSVIDDISTAIDGMSLTTPTFPVTSATSRSFSSVSRTSIASFTPTSGVSSRSSPGVPTRFSSGSLPASATSHHSSATSTGVSPGGSSNSSSSLGTGAIIGIAVGGISLLGGLILFFLLYRRRQEHRRRRDAERGRGTYFAPPSAAEIKPFPLPPTIVAPPAEPSTPKVDDDAQEGRPPSVLTNIPPAHEDHHLHTTQILPYAATTITTTATNMPASHATRNEKSELVLRYVPPDDDNASPNVGSTHPAGPAGPSGGAYVQSTYVPTTYAPSGYDSTSESATRGIGHSPAPGLAALPNDPAAYSALSTPTLLGILDARARASAGYHHGNDALETPPVYRE